MARKRGSETIGDMVRSIVVVLIPVAFVAGIVGLVRSTAKTTPDVDWAETLAVARDDAPFAVVGPSDVPDGWRATRVALERGRTDSDVVWRMNFVTYPDETYIGLVQRIGEVEDVVELEIPDFSPDGSTTVDDETWQRYLEVDANRPDRAVVSERDDSVVVVLGSGDYSELEEFASWLE